MAAPLVTKRLAGDLGAWPLERSDPGGFDASTAGYRMWVGELGVLTSIMTVLFAIVLYRLWPITGPIRTIRVKGVGYCHRHALDDHAQRCGTAGGRRRTKRFWSRNVPFPSPRLAHTLSCIRGAVDYCGAQGVFSRMESAFVQGLHAGGIMLDRRFIVVERPRGGQQPCQPNHGKGEWSD
jgi:hypothetical protein